jgi:hypothetical protein
MNKFNDSWDNFSRYIMIFDFFIPYREFGSLPGYHATTFGPLRGMGIIRRNNEQAIGRY